MLAKRLIIGAISMLIAGTLVAQQSPSSSQTASERLAKVSMFAVGGVGFAGTTSKGEEDFRLVLQSPEAAKAFEDLYERGNGPAKAYALLGLHTLNPRRFEALYASLGTSNKEVIVMRGCIASTRKLKDIAKEIDGSSFVVKPQPRSTR